MIQEDNQQRRIEDRLNWLGGIIDGEGWISVRKTNYSSRHITYGPVIGVVNTDEKIVNEVCNIYKELEIPFYVEKSLYKGTHSFNSKKTQYRIMLIGMKRCQKAIPHLLKGVFAKRHKLLAMQEWIECRLSNRSNYGRQARSYDKEDLRLINLIRESPISLRDFTLAESEPKLIQ